MHEPINPSTFPAFVRAEIENWITSCWDGESPAPREPSRCLSIERNYQTPPWYEDEPPNKPPTYNRENAARTQKVFDAMPSLTRRVLQYEYTQRERYNQWERSVEAYEGVTRPVWICTGNNRRQRARIELKITGVQYAQCLDRFKTAVFVEFEADEILA
jgi:hypothetical protein